LFTTQLKNIVSQLSVHHVDGDIENGAKQQAEYKYSFACVGS
jgi:hypothetical protein